MARPNQACLGTDYDPYDRAQADDPFPLWALARETEPVFFSEVLRSWVVTRHASVQKVLEDAERFTSAGLATVARTPPEVAAILAQIPAEPPLRATDPPDHTRLRRPTQATVNPRRVAGLEPGIRAHAHRLLDAAMEREPDDFYASFGFRYPLAVVGELLGFPLETHDQLHEWANARQAMAWGRMDLETWQGRARDVVAFYRFVEAAVVERLDRPRDDAISDIIAANRAAGEPLSLSETVEMVQGLVTAGHETTAAWLTLSVFHLLTERSRWDYLRAVPEMIPKIAEETLRYDSPVRGLWRNAARDTELGGVAIAAGDRVFVATGAANRDSTRITDADSYLPGRGDSRAMLTFGRGPHMCIGSGLARLEGRVALEVLAERAPDLRLAEGVDRMSFVLTVTLRIPTALPVHWR